MLLLLLRAAPRRAGGAPSPAAFARRCRRSPRRWRLNIVSGRGARLGSPALAPQLPGGAPGRQPAEPAAPARPRPRSGAQPAERQPGDGLAALTGGAPAPRLPLPGAVRCGASRRVPPASRRLAADVTWIPPACAAASRGAAHTPRRAAPPRPGSARPGPARPAATAHLRPRPPDPPRRASRRPERRAAERSPAPRYATRPAAPPRRGEGRR